MIKYIKKIFLKFCICNCLIVLISSKRPDSKKKIVSFAADELKYKKDGEKGINILNGNVIFRKEDITIYADSALYEEQKKIEAFGNIKIINKDGSILKTSIVKYDIDKELAEFEEEVTLINGEDTLKSDTGQYNDGTDIATFNGNVEINNKDQKFKCNKLIYDNLNENYIKQHKDLFNNIEYKENSKQKVYVASGNIEIESFKDNTLIKGENSIHYKNDNRLKVYGEPIIRKIINKDKLYLYGNKILIQNNENSEKKSDKKVTVLGNAAIFNKDIQARSQTIKYIPNKSVIYFSIKPTFWNDQNQITSDIAKLTLQEENLKEMQLQSNVMLIQKTKEKNYNQLIGDDMSISFIKNKVDIMLLKGNAECIQFLDDNEKKEPKLVGMNHIKCEKIKIKIKKNTLNKIIFLGIKNKTNIVKGMLLPPKKITPKNNKFKNFEWRIYERPTIETINYLMNRKN